MNNEFEGMTPYQYWLHTKYLSNTAEVLDLHEQFGKEWLKEFKRLLYGEEENENS